MIFVCSITMCVIVGKLQYFHTDASLFVVGGVDGVVFVGVVRADRTKVLCNLRFSSMMD